MLAYKFLCNVNDMRALNGTPLSLKGLRAGHSLGSLSRSIRQHCLDQKIRDPKIPDLYLSIPALGTLLSLRGLRAEVKGNIIQTLTFARSIPRDGSQQSKCDGLDQTRTGSVNTNKHLTAPVR